MDLHRRLARLEALRPSHQPVVPVETVEEARGLLLGRGAAALFVITGVPQQEKAHAAADQA